MNTIPLSSIFLTNGTSYFTPRGAVIVHVYNREQPWIMQARSLNTINTGQWYARNRKVDAICIRSAWSSERNTPAPKAKVGHVSRETKNTNYR